MIPAPFMSSSFPINQEKGSCISLSYYPTPNRSIGKQENLSHLNFGDVYLNGNSLLKSCEVMSTKDVIIQIEIEYRKPFRLSECTIQLENENLRAAHVDDTPLLLNNGYATVYEEGYNELFNTIHHTTTLTLKANQVQKLIFCWRIAAEYSEKTGSNKNHSSKTPAKKSTSEQSMMDMDHLFDGNEQFKASELSYAQFKGRILFHVQKKEENERITDDYICTLLGNVCRSVLRVNVEEVRFDNCVPGGTYYEDFAVWNRSEIPLLFTVHPSTSLFTKTKELLHCAKYDGKREDTISHVFRVAAFGHQRIRVTFKPQRVGHSKQFGFM